MIVHSAAQPSHDRAAAIRFLDFEVNALGTLNMLEAARQGCPESPFIHMSTNKVYGDRANTILFGSGGTAQPTELRLDSIVHLQGVCRITLDYPLLHEAERIKEISACLCVTKKWVKFNNQIPGPPQEIRIVLQEL